MLFIAVRGPVGAGKSTLLETLATWWTTQGKDLDGFVCTARGQRVDGGGAPGYELHWLASGERLPFGERDESLSPPYRFSLEGVERMASWGRTLAARDPVPLLIMDELGRLEAAGGGLLAVWPMVEAAQPEILVAAVREGCETAIQQRLGRRFDLVIDAREQGAWERVRAACVEHADWSRVGLYGAGSGGVEVTIGSALHGAQIPLRGLMLSSAQAAVMAHAGEGLGRRMRVVWVPFIAAGLKALSPAGSRLRPMLAITIQGILFALASAGLGWNALGVFVAGALVGMWATAQGLILQYLMVGADLIRAYDVVVGWVTARWHIGVPGLVTVLAVWFGAWGLTSGSLALLVWRRRSLPARLHAMMDRGTSRAHIQQQSGGRVRALAHAARDLARPVFWLPVLLVATILLISGSPAERAFWVVGRAATIGFLLFAIVRMVEPPRVIEWLRARGHWGPAVAFARALDGRPRGSERGREP